MSDFSDHGDSTEAGEAPPRPSLVSSSSAPAGHHAATAWEQPTPAASDTTSEALSAAAAPSTAAVELTRFELTPMEARVLGCLIEKSYLTPDVYPMTTNGLVTACNQKTNRDPVVSYSAVDIDSALMEMRQRNLVRRVHEQGARSTKHRQTLDEALTLTEKQLVLLSVLLLRGDQTMGELRIRTERHNVGFDDLDAIDACLDGLARRDTPLVRELPRQPGHKENRWRHLLLDATVELDEPPAGRTESASTQAAPTQAAVEAQRSEPVVAAASADADLVARVAELEDELATLRQQLSGLADKLGEPLD